MQNEKKILNLIKKLTSESYDKTNNDSIQAIIKLYEERSLLDLYPGIEELPIHDQIKLQKTFEKTQNNIEFLTAGFTPGGCQGLTFGDTLGKMEHEGGMMWLINVMQKNGGNKWSANIEHFAKGNNHFELERRGLVKIENNEVSFTKRGIQLIGMRYLIWKYNVENQILEAKKVFLSKGVDIIHYDDSNYKDQKIIDQINAKIVSTLKKVLSYVNVKQGTSKVTPEEIIKIVKDNDDFIDFSYSYDDKNNPDTGLAYFVSRYIPLREYNNETKYIHAFDSEVNALGTGLKNNTLAKIINTNNWDALNDITDVKNISTGYLLDLLDRLTMARGRQSTIACVFFKELFKRNVYDDKFIKIIKNYKNYVGDHSHPQRYLGDVFRQYYKNYQVYL